MLKQLFLLFVGAGIVILGVMAEVAWLGLCFGTVIIGLAMLVFSPTLLILPVTFIVMPGVFMTYIAYTNLQEIVND